MKQLISEFLSIFDGVCRSVKGPPCHFKLRDGEVPTAVKDCHPVSVTLLSKLKDALQSVENK
ncbi:hypothetical protein T11_14481 [Trichinella zimbabwensis]|uniref:Uncharacterized protein n=1 Tax=Trichinella zimbabwensis TaxID=268475 RepID=A0A0V1H2G6_9BILA|nr:hypothetical protein T11_14481 [Trichinella zimbabwensis]